MSVQPRGPYVIAAVGGSGTRVLAAIVRQSGMWIGTNLNGPLDALDLADYCTRWIPTYAGAAGPLSPTIMHRMRQDLSDVVEKHLADLNDDNAPWGWKNSGSLHLLRLVHDAFPNARFVHMVRDGRDMAYSPNQYQVRRYGDLLLTPEERRWSQPLRSIVVWSRLNLMAADYADQHLPNQYLLVRFEDLCTSPVPTVQRILDFCGLNGDAVRIARDHVVAPSSIGRWRHQPQRTVARLNEIARVALQRFGYGDGHSMKPIMRMPRGQIMAFEDALRSRLSAGLGGDIAERYRQLRHGRWHHGR